MPPESSLCGTLSEVFLKPTQSQSFTLAKILEWGKKELEFLGSAEAAEEAEKLLEEIVDSPRSTLYLEAERQIPAKDLRQYQEWIQCRKKRIPLAYILGKAYFWEESLEVGPGCLIPRPETEVLVERFIEVSGFSKENRFHFLDAGCGSGAIGIALLRYFQNARATFLDSSENALQFTRRNLARYSLGDRAEVVHSDLFEAVRSAAGENPRKWDAMISNPPYLSKEDWENLAPEILFEPREALDGGRDGLAFYDRILSEATEFLNPGGRLALEVGKGQAACVRVKMQKSNFFREIQIFKDYNNIERVVLGRAN